jgi:hypothetical protein
VILATGDVLNVPDVDRVRRERVFGVSPEDMSTKLVLLVAAPGPNHAVYVEG